ncbi:glycosyltransferase family 4 protein [Thermosipho sp. 1070]|uniref:glycosyltransferase family 4 protein n=1 Tax=Thermosipho sp. 1070 TaxID=1437364 RepID=UPI00094944DF|nr:glycosyltransferase family 4 protein [Thermosipho sp. 1070]ANQ54610.1 hypothetical protein Y592_04225 [Thermosipho sp. 1070]
MKILHISQYYNDEYGYQENLLPFYQSLLGHEVIHVTSDRMSSFVDKAKRIIGAKKYIEKNNIRIIRLPIKWEFRGRFVIFKDLYSVLEKEKPDYIFHHGLISPSILEVIKYKRKYGIFLATDNHSDLNISGKNRLWLFLYYRAFWTNLLKKHYKYIDLIFGVTPLRCLFPVKYLGAPMDRIRLLPIGANVLEVPKVDKETLREKYGVSENKIIFVTGGKITPKKQMDKILDAFKMLNSDIVELIVFGKILDKKFEEKAKELKNLKFLGWRNRKETLEILKMSDVAIWNTIHTTLIEDAIAVETPLILRYYGSTAHFIDGNGLYLYSDSVKELYEKMKFIIKNREILEKMRNSTKKIKELLSYEQIAKESIEYFYDLAPKETHNHFMNDKFLDFNYEYFEKIL